MPPRSGSIGGGEIVLPGVTMAPHVEVTEYFAGPLPSPDALFGYDQALPGTADRIITLAEREASHRHSLEQRLLSIQSRNSIVGIASGLVLGLSGILGGVYAAVNGAGFAGAGVAFTALASLAGVFVAQRREARTEPPAKQQA